MEKEFYILIILNVMKASGESTSLMVMENIFGETVPHMTENGEIT